MAGSAVAYFDNAEGGVVISDATLHPMFSDSFESQSIVGAQPLTGPPIATQNYVDGQWYLERDGSDFQIETSAFALSGTHVAAADVGPTNSGQSPLSAAVALVQNSPDMQNFLSQPGDSYMQAYVRFEPGMPNDIIMFVDQELLEGVESPAHTKGGDWMALAGVQPTGVVWVAAGTEATAEGQPSTDRNWKIYDLGQQLQPDAWYQLRVDADFNHLTFKSFSISGPGLNEKIDLSGLPLDYPNYMPFDHADMGYFVGALNPQFTGAGESVPSNTPMDNSGPSPIESNGGTTLATAANQFYLLDSMGAGPTLKWSGADVVAGQFGGWTPIGAEITATGYEIAWKIPGSDQYTLWSTDNNGNYLAHDADVVSGSSSAIVSAEISFQQDLNGDGQVGPSIESNGGTTLAPPANQVDLLDSPAAAPLENPTIGSVDPPEQGQQLPDADAVSGASAAMVSVESSFQQHPNGDGDIGTPIESNGDDALIGHSGDDDLHQLTGGSGSDILEGVSGNDVFVFHPVEGNGDSGLDLTPGPDRLHLSSFGAHSSFVRMSTTDWSISHAIDSHTDTIHFTTPPLIHVEDSLFG